MNENAPNPNQISLFDETPEPDQLQENTVLPPYKFSAVNSYPAAEAAHAQQEQRLGEDRENQGMNPANKGFLPHVTEETHQHSAGTKPKANTHLQKSKQLNGRAATVADTNGIRAAHHYGTQK